MESKVCTKCAVEKPFTEFYSGKRMTKRRGEVLSFSGACKRCTITGEQDRYFANHEAKKEWHREYNRKSQTGSAIRKGKKQLLREWIKECKAKPCQDCSSTFPPECMDFDHRDPAAKKQCVGTMIANTQKKATIEAEIAKCDLVCANCHRIRTAKQFGWY